MRLSRPSSRWYALLLAAAVTLILNPRASGDPAWQLSFVAVAGILMVGRPLAARLRRVAEELAGPPRSAGPRGSAGPPTGLRGGAAPAAGLRGGAAPDAGLRGGAAPDAGPRAGQRSALARAALDGLCEGIAITVAATLATAPLLAYHFGSVPLAGLPANLLALPAVAPAMWLGMVKAALGLVGPLLPAADRLAELLGPLTRVPIEYLDGLAERCATLPGGRLELPLGSPPAVVAAYAAMAALAYGPRLARRAAAARIGAELEAHAARAGEATQWGAAVRAGTADARVGAGRSAPAVGWRARHLRPGALELAAAWRRGPRAFRAGAAAFVAVVLVLAAGAVLAAPAPPDVLTVRFLDVGQGDATLIQDGAGTNVLFDAGPPEARVYRHLRAAGVTRLDLIVSTHQSRDHQGGFHELIDRLPTRLMIENGDSTRDPDFRRLIDEADARGIPTARRARARCCGRVASRSRSCRRRRSRRARRRPRTPIRAGWPRS